MLLGIQTYSYEKRGPDARYELFPFVARPYLPSCSNIVLTYLRILFSNVGAVGKDRVFIIVNDLVVVNVDE